jgi:DNA-binding XRE family transcriptional regulator
MSRIKPIAEDSTSVTLTRADFEALLVAAENAQDVAAFNERRAREAQMGKDAARADDLPVELVERLLAGESPVRIWREHRGMTQRALAQAAGVSTAYLSEIESGAKPGSVAALRKIGRILAVRMEELCSSSSKV